MLILGRYIGSSVIIEVDGREIEVVVLGHDKERPDQVRLGFNAPDDVLIDREEIYSRKKHEQLL